MSTDRTETGASKFTAIILSAVVAAIVAVGVTASILGSKGPKERIISYNMSPIVMNPLPKHKADSFELIKDTIVFDLREWAPLTGDKAAKPELPSPMTNVLTYRKLRDEDFVSIHLATSGYKIDATCLTHPFKFYIDAPTIPHRGGEKNFAVYIDVSNEPVGSEFTIVIAALYWNGFGGPTKEAASTYVDAHDTGLEHLELVVMFPSSKKPKTIDAFEESDAEASSPVKLSVPSLKAQREILIWDVSNPKPGHHYSLAWTW